MRKVTQYSILMLLLISNSLKAEIEPKTLDESLKIKRDVFTKSLANKFQNGCIQSATGPTGATGATGKPGPTGATGSMPIGAVTSANTTGCSNQLAIFNGTSTTKITNAAVVSGPVNSTTQATSFIKAQDCATTNLNLALIPKGTGALIAAIPDGTATGGNIRGTNAVDLQTNRALSTQVASGNSSVIGGGANNISSSFFSTVSGGFTNIASSPVSTVSGGTINTASGNTSTISGGNSNTASGPTSTIGGGESNTTSGNTSVISGGSGNIASGDFSAVSGGQTNNASGSFATVGGGNTNIASGQYSTVPGGVANSAIGEFSFAAGNNAIANNTGSFVWSDSNGGNADTDINQFIVQASGNGGLAVAFYTNLIHSTGVTLNSGANAWASICDRNKKENFQDLDTIEILNKLVNTPIQSWNYKDTDPSNRYIGPMAQDFNPIFFGKNDLTISTLDFDGVALASIQGMYKLHKQEISELKQEINDLRNEIAELKKG